MSIITKNKSKAAQKLICLKRTRHITEDDVFLPEWKTLKDEYDAHQDGEWVDKAIVSLLNSAIYQHRVVFVLAKRSFRELAKSDKNWKRAIGLKDENWKTLIQEVTNREIVKCIHRTDKGRLVYEIIENDILNLINIDVVAQRNEAIQFANEMNDLDEGTTQGTTEGNRELELERELERETEKTNQQIKTFKEDEIEIDLSFNTPELHNSSSSPENVRIGANTSPKQQRHAPIKSSKTTPSVDIKNNNITPEAILARWKPSKVDSKDLETTISQLFSTLKHYSVPKDEVPTKKIIKTMFGPSPSEKINWLVEKATQVIDEQRELTYAPEIQMQEAPLEAPVKSGSRPGQLRRKDFDSDRAYELYHDAITSGREVWSLGGSIAEYYNQQAYTEQFPIITK